MLIIAPLEALIAVFQKLTGGGVDCFDSQAATERAERRVRNYPR
jgi:hypothetical protein